jgi:hypothetical protein
VTDVFRQIGTVLILISALLAVACVVAHHALARWWNTGAGRHAFTFEAVLALSLSLWTLRLAIPDGDWFQIVRLVAFAFVPVVLAWRLTIIIQTWRRQRSKNR